MKLAAMRLPSHHYALVETDFDAATYTTLLNGSAVSLGRSVLGGASTHALPARPAIGVNADSAALMASCPKRRYERCFFSELSTRYPVASLRIEPARHAGIKPAPHARPLGTSGFEQHAGLPLDEEGRCAAAPAPPPPQSARATCGDPASGASVVLLLGVPTSPTPTGAKRRAAIRASWMRDGHVGRDVLACFLLSSQKPPAGSRAAAAAPEIAREAAEHGDILTVDAPETPWLITRPTGYSNFTRGGRGMPTFKQYAFFRLAATRWAHVPFVGKIDDDTAPSLRLLVPLLRELRCPLGERPAFIGAINWAAFVPRALPEGVRGDRCGFGWSLHASLSNFGRAWGTRGAKGYLEACDVRGAVLPFPYATGAGYIFNAPLLQHVGRSEAVASWVADARGADHEELQWQKYEDTTTGYWASYSPKPVQYVDVGALIHDVHCHAEGARKRLSGGLYRPPANVSLLVHNLKTASGFDFAWRHTRAAAAAPYDHKDCLQTILGRSPARAAADAVRDAAKAREKAAGAPAAAAVKRSNRFLEAARRGDEKWLRRQRNVDLQDALRSRGLNTVGRKGELVSRLLSSVQS